MDLQDLAQKISEGDNLALSRGISLVINEYNGYEQLLIDEFELPVIPVIGVTGPPGAGKSTLLDGLIEEVVREQSNAAVLCVDPSSTFTHGAILGDRIRMSQWYNHPQVYIRSLATRGQLGGLPPMINPIIDLVKRAPFDYIFIETVGVGQNEIEIAQIADLTLVVLVPEGGDDIQVMKAGLMEIADIFVVNKSDRPGADLLYNDLKQSSRVIEGSKKKRIVRTIANTRQGLPELGGAIRALLDPEQ